MPTSPSWDRVSELFDQALERPPGERAAWLDEACGADAALRQEVEQLLAAHDRAEGVLEQRPSDVLADDSPPSEQGPRPGRRFGPYLLGEEIGRGGMGVVFKANDTQLDRTVALKFLSHELLVDENVRKRFLREARAAAALDHPHICKVYGVDEEDGETFIVMAYVEGESLEAKISAGALPLAEAVEIASQVGRAVEQAHAAGIIHRDVKPANVIVEQGAGPHAVILDFGLARLVDESRLTRTGTVLGTPAYMSPEQLRGSDADARADIWSLGVILYEMIAGRQPFRAEHGQAAGYAIINEKPERLTQVREGIPPKLDWIIGKALAKNPDERYQRIEELLIDLKTLRGAAEKRIVEARGPGSRSVSQDSGNEASQYDGSRVFWWMAGLVLLAAITWAWTR